MAQGVKFSIDTNDIVECEDESEEMNFFNFPDIEENLIPFEQQSFDELKSRMTEVCEGVWKIPYKEAPKNSTQVNFAIHRVTYHRNLYMENEAYPFDSTWMNSKPDVICNDTEKYLEGILDALVTMKEGEQSYFVISYTKMFKEQGCFPRVLPKADILCDLKVLQVEEIGDQKHIAQLDDHLKVRTFAEIKSLSEEGRLRGKFLFSNQKLKDAIKIYKKVFQAIELCRPSNDDEKREQKELKIQIMINLATCFNIQQEPKKALSFIDDIEKICDISNNPKILFIKGKASRMNGDYKGACIALKKANTLRPHNTEIISELEKLDSSMSDYSDIDKKLSKSLFIN